MSVKGAAITLKTIKCDFIEKVHFFMKEKTSSMYWKFQAEFELSYSAQTWWLKGKVECLSLVTD